MADNDYQDNNIQLMHGDCLSRLAELEDDSVDLVFTSPPYNLNLRIRDGKYCSRQIIKEISTKYANFDDNLPIDEYYEFQKSVIDELLRVSPLVFYNVQFLTGNKRALYKIIGNYSEQLKEFIIWDKKVAEPAIGEGVLNSRWEAILVFDRNNAISRKFDKAQFDRGTLQNLWEIKRDRKTHPEHGATFPLELAERVIRSFSEENDTVLDPFLGTGTTGYASCGLKRKFIGIEIDMDYYEYSKRRILSVPKSNDIFKW